MPQVTGTFVSLKNGSLTLRHGGNKPVTTHSVAADATCTVNGQTAKLSDLQDDDSISISGDPVVSVSARR